MQSCDLIDLIPKYQAFVIDLWGVVHDGVHAYPGVVDCLNHMLNLNKRIIFVSNSPRPSGVLMQKLIDFKISVEPSMLLSSGDIVSEQLTYFNDDVFKKLGRRVYHLKAESDSDLFALEKMQAIEVSSIEKADFLLVSAYASAGADFNYYDGILKKALDCNLPFICANPDKIILFGDSMYHCPGFFAQKYEEMGGIVHYYGKPHKAIYQIIFNRLASFDILDRKQILMIGDTLETDIQGAKLNGCDSALVLTGNAESWLEKNEKSTQTTTQFLTEHCLETGIIPTWVLQGLKL